MAPTATFSATVRFGNGRTIWWVRTMPARTSLCAGRPDTLNPRMRTSPEVGGIDPAMRLKSVVFPAPFGPMTPRISPCRSSRSTWSTALRPPKLFEIARVARRGAAAVMARRPPARRGGGAGSRARPAARGR